MGQLLRFASVAVVCLSLVGCYQSLPPIKSASFTRWHAGKARSQPQQLTSEQVAKLSDWLQNHKWGWHPVAGTFLPVTLISLSHADGTFSSANLMKNIVIVGQHQRGLSESESQELHSIVGVQYGN
jgi:hypothetical protein